MQGIPDIKSSLYKIKPSYFLYIGLGVFFYMTLIFLPVLVIPFVHHDDYNFFLPTQTIFGIHFYPPVLNGFLLGREVLVLLDSLFMPLIHNVSDLAFFRMLTIFLSTISVILFSYRLIKINLSLFIALIISLMIFLLPGAQFYILFVNGCGMMVAIFLGLMASELFSRATDKSFFRNNFFCKILPAFTLFFIALNTYQAAAMFFLVPVLALTVFSPFTYWNRTRKIVMFHITFFTIGVIIYFLFHRFIALPIFEKMFKIARNQGDLYEFSLTANILEKVKFFIFDLSPQSLNLWNIYPKISITMLSIGLITLGVIFSFFNYKKNLNFKARNCFEVFFITILLLLLSNLPNLSAKGGLAVYRATFVYSAMIIILVAWSILVISQKIPTEWRSHIVYGAFLLCLVLGSLLADSNVAATAVSDNKELSYMKAEIANQEGKKLVGIHVIRPHGGVSFLNLPYRIDEFNAPSTHFPQDIPMMLHVIVGNKSDQSFSIIESSAYKKNYS